MKTTDCLLLALFLAVITNIFVSMRASERAAGRISDTWARLDGIAHDVATLERATYPKLGTNTTRLYVNAMKVNWLVGTNLADFYTRMINDTNIMTNAVVYLDVQELTISDTNIAIVRRPLN